MKSVLKSVLKSVVKGVMAGITAITDFLYYDPDSAYVDNASITNRGTSGTDAVGYSGKSYDFDGVNDFVTLTVSATLTYIELWVKPDTTTMAICDFGAGKEIALTTGTVGTTGLGTVSVTVDGVSSTTMVALKWQLLRVTLDSPTAITTLRLGRNDTTYGSGQISDVQINDSTSYLETNQASSTGVFDSVQGVLATNSGCALIEGLSGLENGETHNGIPQSFSKNWNRYQLFKNDGVVKTINTGAITLNNGDSVKWKIYILGGDVNKNIATSTTNTPYWRISGTTTVTLFDSVGGYNFPVTILENQLEEITFSLSGTSLTVETSTNSNTKTIGDSSLTFDLIGDRVNTELEGFIHTIEKNGTVVFNGTNQGVDLVPIPENPSSLGNDIFTNAIVDAQPKFKLDGASYGDTGQTVAIDYNTPFTITANGVYIYDSTSNNAIFSNRDNTANQRGVLAYLDTSNRPVLLMQLNTTTRVQVQSNVAISNDDNLKWISDGTGDASGVTIKINAAAVATTTLQDQDISTGITSAANAYFGIDLDGTANELKGSTGIITLDL